MVTIKVTGMVQCLTAVRLIGEGGRAVNGPLATFGSRLPYAMVINTGMRYGRPWRKAGPALFFEKGIADTVPMVGPLLTVSIPLGNASVGQAKRKIRDAGIAAIQRYTPVRSGALRASISELSRPGIA